MRILLSALSFLFAANSYGSATLDLGGSRATMLLPDGDGAFKYVYCENISEAAAKDAKDVAQVAEKNTSCRIIMSGITLEKLEERFSAAESYYQAEYERLKKNPDELKKTVDLIDYEAAKRERRDFFGTDFNYPDVTVFLGACRYGIPHNKDLHQSLYAANEANSAKGKSRESTLKAEIEGCSKRLSTEFPQARKTIPTMFQGLLKSAADPNGKSVPSDEFETQFLQFVSLFAPEERSPEKRMPIPEYQEEKKKCAQGLKKALDELISGKLKIAANLTKNGLKRIDSLILELNTKAKQKELGLASCRYSISNLNAQAGYLSLMSNHNSNAFAIDPEKDSNLELAKVFEEALPHGFSPNGYESVRGKQSNAVVLQLKPEGKLPLAAH